MQTDLSEKIKEVFNEVKPSPELLYRIIELIELSSRRD